MNHRQRNATLVFLQASDERRVFSARPHVSNFLILHHESSCIWIFYAFFCFPVASTNLIYDLFSSTLSKYKGTTERKSARPLSSIMCCEKQHTLGKAVLILRLFQLSESPFHINTCKRDALLHTCCLFVFFFVFCAHHQKNSPSNH